MEPLHCIHHQLLPGLVRIAQACGDLRLSLSVIAELLFRQPAGQTADIPLLRHADQAAFCVASS